MHKLRRAALLVLALLVVAGLSVSSAAASGGRGAGGVRVTGTGNIRTPMDPHPRPPCFRTGCNGQDPDILGCDVDSPWNPTWTSPPVYLNEMWVVLRYSPWCEANWAKGDHYWSIWVQNSSGSSGGYSQGNWTVMVDGEPGVTAQGCVWNPIGTVCTDPY